jgi:hypothetical protein
VQRRSKKGGLARGGHTESSSLNVEGQAELNFQLEEWNADSNHFLGILERDSRESERFLP